MSSAPGSAVVGAQAPTGASVGTSARSNGTSRASSPTTRTQHVGALGVSMPTLPQPPLGLSALMQGMLSKFAATSPLGLDAKTTGSPWPPYQPDLMDPVDRTVFKLLNDMGQEALSRLMIRRLGPGKYEIDGRKVSVYCAPSGGEGGFDASELLAREDEVGGEEGCPELSLQAYLQQAANVAAALRGRVPGAAAVTRIPQEKRLTFSSTGSDALESLDALQRCASMKKACEEAALRERAAEAYENGMRYVQLPTSKSEPDAIKAQA